MLTTLHASLILFIQGDEMPTIPIPKWRAQKRLSVMVEEQSVFTRKIISQFYQKLHAADPLLPSLWY